MATSIACLGDSITYTAPTRADVPYPHKLEQLLGSGYAVGQYGVSGDTTSQMATRWTSSIRNKNFSVLCLMGGINDILNGTTGAGASAWTNLDGIITEALTDGLTVVLFEVLPCKGYSGWTVDKQTEIDSLNTSIAGRAGVTLVSSYSDFEDAVTADAMKAAYDAGDGLHPNQAGSDRLATLAYNAITGA